MNVSEILSAIAKKCYLLINVNLDNGQYDRLLSKNGKSQIVCGQQNYDRAMREDIYQKVSKDYQQKMIALFSIEGLRQQLKNQNTFEYEYQMGKADKKWVRISADVVKREQKNDHEIGKVIEVVIGFTDITTERTRELESRQREKRLFDVIEAQNEKLKLNLRTANSTNDAKTQFLSNLSHEMRVSINAIMGMNEIAYKNYDNPEMVKHLLANMKSPIETLTSLLNHVTDVRTIESGKTSAKNSVVNIKKVVKECCEILQTGCDEKRLHMHASFRNVQHEMIVTDKVRLKQIIINVLDNAVKYTQENGEITLEIAELGSAKQNESRYCFTIEDNGKGMSKEFLDTVFNPFAKTKMESENVGLGLSIVKTLTELLGGHIKIYSRPNHGTKVELIFPFQYRKDVAESTPQNNEKNNLHLKKFDNLYGKKILLVEDERIHRQILVYNLEEQGMLCDWTSSGEEALAKMKVAEDGFYECIITDIRLPGMKGNELTEIIRQSSRDYFQRIPIIAVSADAIEEHMRNYMKSGITAYLTKPILPENLYRVLNQLLK